MRRINALEMLGCRAERCERLLIRVIAALACKDAQLRDKLLQKIDADIYYELMVRS